MMEIIHSQHTGSALEKCKSVLEEFLLVNKEEIKNKKYNEHLLMMMEDDGSMKFINTIFLGINEYYHHYYYITSESRIIKHDNQLLTVLYDFAIDELNLDDDIKSLLKELSA